MTDETMGHTQEDCAGGDRTAPARRVHYRQSLAAELVRDEHPRLFYKRRANELRLLAQNKVALLGNIPPRDVLAGGSIHDVTSAAVGLLNSLEERSKVIVSCGGGMPPGVETGNISAFVQAVRDFPVKDTSAARGTDAHTS